MVKKKSKLLLMSSLMALLFSCSNGSSFSSRSVHRNLDVTPWDGTVASSLEEGDGTSSNPYLIKDGKDLAYIKNNSIFKSGFSGKYFQITKDIDLNNLPWSGIGNGTSSGAFKGNIDGGNHEIRNISIEATTERKGFFNSVNGNISNIKLKNCSLTVDSFSSNGYGGLFAAINYGSITNCSAEGEIDVKGIYVGGMIGCNYGGDVSSLSFKGKTRGTRATGGIIGYNGKNSGKIGNITNCTNYGEIQSEEIMVSNYYGIGGIIGVNGSGCIIDGCVNNGIVKPDGASSAGTGGIVGNNFASTIQNCLNNGEISAKENVAGICGYPRASGTYIHLTNRGKVSGDYAVAGILGYARSSVSLSDNYGEISSGSYKQGYWIGGIVGMLGSNLTVTSCNNYGLVSGIGSTSGGVGGIVGSNYNSSISNCLNEGHIYGEYRLGGIAGFSQSSGGIISNCTNKGEIESKIEKGSLSIGGIIGFNTAEVIYCKNYGNIKVHDEELCSMYGPIIGYDKAGDGLVYGNENLKGESL